MKSCLYNFDIEKVRVHRTTPARRSRAVQFWLTKFTLHRLYLSYLAQASFLQKNQTCKTFFWYLSWRDDKFDLKLNLKSSISVHLFWSLWFYFRGFRFCLHKMFNFVVLVQPENNVCQNFMILIKLQKRTVPSLFQTYQKNTLQHLILLKNKACAKCERYKWRKANLVTLVRSSVVKCFSHLCNLNQICKPKSHWNILRVGTPIKEFASAVVWLAFFASIWSQAMPI